MERDFSYYANLANQYNKANMALVLARDALAPICNREPRAEHEDDIDQKLAKDIRQKLNDIQKEIRKEAYQNEELADNAAMDDLPF